MDKVVLNWRCDVVDADIEKFFDNVNHDKLMILVEQRISDRRILKLMRQWLKAGVLYGSIYQKGLKKYDFGSMQKN